MKHNKILLETLCCTSTKATCLFQLMKTSS
jgi:hypothetical protein